MVMARMGDAGAAAPAQAPPPPAAAMDSTRPPRSRRRPRPRPASEAAALAVTTSLLALLLLVGGGRAFVPPAPPSGGPSPNQGGQQPPSGRPSTTRLQSSTLPRQQTLRFPAPPPLIPPPPIPTARAPPPRKEEEEEEAAEAAAVSREGQEEQALEPGALPAMGPVPTTGHPDQLQARAIASTARYTLLVAGAGTGKTRVLAARAAHLVQTGKARPEEILVLSFTNAAARSIQGRANALLVSAGLARAGGKSRMFGGGGSGGSGEQVVDEMEELDELEDEEEGEYKGYEEVAEGGDALLTAGTFHGLAASIIKAHAHLALGRPYLRVAGRPQQLQAMRRAMQAAFGVPAVLVAPGDRAQQRVLDQEADDMLRFVSLWKSSGALPEDLHPSVCQSREEARACRLYPHYQQELAAQGLLDFDDLVMVALDLLLSYPEVLRKYQRRFKHILVDEFQDTNEAQYALLRTLALGATPPNPDADLDAQLQHCPKVMCAGDDDQSIYSFRGARAGRAFAAFLADFPQAVAVGLPISYRLPGHLYVAAQEMIARNSPPPLLPPSVLPPEPETLLDYYSTGAAPNGSSAAWGGTADAAAAVAGQQQQPQQSLEAGVRNSAGLPPIPPRDYQPRLPPGVELERVQEATLSRISVQEVWDDMDEARWIARKVKELYVSFGTASFTWEERAQLYQHQTTAPQGEGGEEPAPPPAAAGGEHQIAILVRSGWQLRVLEEALVQQRLPYVVQGGASLVAGKEARAALGLLGALIREGAQSQSQQQDASFPSDALLEKAAAALGHKRATVRSILAAARRDGVSVEEAAAWARVDGGSSLPPTQFNGQQPTAVAPTLPRVLADIPRWARELQKGYGKGGAAGRKAIERILTEAGILAPSPSTPTTPAPADDTTTKKRATTKKAGLTGLPRLLALMTDAFEELPPLGAWCRAVRGGNRLASLPPAVRERYYPQEQQGGAQRKVILSTMHGAKGQEFDLVFLAGWDEGVFPVLPRGGGGKGKGKGGKGKGAGAAPAFLTAAEEAAAAAEQEAAAARLLSEERRLAYVALTRARLNAYITFTHRRRLPGGAWATTTPSRFIAELPRRLVRLGLLGPRVLGRAPKPTNDADFRRIRPEGVKTRGDDLLVNGGGAASLSPAAKVDPLSLPRRPPTVPTPVLEPQPQQQPQVEQMEMGPGAPVVDASVLAPPPPIEAPMAVGEPQEEEEEAAAPVAMAAAKQQQQSPPPQAEQQEQEQEPPQPLILVDPTTAPRLNPSSIHAAAEAIATTAAIARGLALAGEETAVGRARKAGRAAKLAASLKRILPPTPIKDRRKGGGKGGVEGYEVVPSLLSLLEGDPAKVVALRPFYRACLQACGRRLANFPSREDPSTLLPLSQCPTQHLGLLAVAHLVSPAAGIVQREGWGALRTLFRRLLSRYGFGGVKGAAGLKVPVARKQGAKQQKGGVKVELRPLAQCSGSELADVLLALLAQEEGRLPSDEPPVKRRRGKSSKKKE